MLWFIIAIVIGIGSLRAEEDKGFSAFILSVSLAVAAIMNVCFLEIHSDSSLKLYETHELVSMGRTDHTTGKFLLGSGHLDGAPKYTFYQKVGEGYKLKTVLATKDVLVFEQDRHEGELRIYKAILTDKKRRTWRWYSVFHFWEMNMGEHYHFYIPAGSVDKQFSL